MIITSYINKGNSFPVILEDKEQKYFVKLRAGMSGKYALLSEWIGNKIGTELKIKTQIPNWIELKKDVVIDDLHVEVKELIIKSLGTNIGFEYQEQAKEIAPNEIAIIPKKIAHEIYLLDLVMINIDRTPNNMNLMKVAHEIVSVDYESSLLVQTLIENKDLLNHHRILQCLRNNPLYEAINEEEIDLFIKKLEQLSIETILAEIPFDLLSQKDRDSVIKGFAEKNRHQWNLKESMSKLKALKRTTKEDEKRRRSENQAAFKRKFKENTKG